MKCTQTDLTQEKVEELVSRNNTELEVQGAKIDELSRRLTSSQKTTETQKDTINRCLAVIKENKSKALVQSLGHFLEFNFYPISVFILITKHI